MTANRAKDSFRGSVKELYAKTVTVTGKDKDVSEEFQTLRFARYDQSGNKVAEAYFDSNNSLLYKTVWTYDSAGKLVEQANFDASESPTFKTIFEYDRAGRLVEKKTFASGGALETVIRPKYTAEGLRIEEEIMPFSEVGEDLTYFIGIKETDMSFSACGIRKIRKIYDDKGKLLDITLYKDKEKRTGKILLDYDENGRLLETAHYGGGEFYPPAEKNEWQHVLEPLIMRSIKIFIFLKCVCGFGIKGELRKAARCFVYGSLSVLNVFVYNDKGWVVEEQTHFLSLMMSKKIFAYNREGDKAEEIEYFNDESVQRQVFSREYDSHRNWIEETARQFQTNEEPEQRVFTNRTISYYSC